MKEKDIKGLLEAYREEVQNGAHWESREAYLDRCRNVYDKYCIGKTTEEQVLTWLALLKKPLFLGVYESFSTGDMAMLNDALAQGARHAQNGAIHASGVDHSLYAFRILPELLAANLFERVPMLLPETLGLSNNGYITGIPIINLFMALWYERTDYAETARVQAEKCLQHKRNITHMGVMRYLLALLDKDCDMASEQLAVICQGCRRSSDFGETKFTRSFAVQAHGWYNLSNYVYGGALEGQVRMPEESNFSQALALWQREHGYIPGGMYIVYPAPMELVNVVLNAEPPATTLRALSNSRKLCIDADSFKERMVQNVLRLCAGDVSENERK